MATAANADSKLSEGKYKTISFLRNQKRLNGKNEKNTLEYAFAYYSSRGASEAGRRPASRAEQGEVYKNTHKNSSTFPGTSCSKILHLTRDGF